MKKDNKLLLESLWPKNHHMLLTLQQCLNDEVIESAIDWTSSPELHRAFFIGAAYQYLHGKINMEHKNVFRIKARIRACKEEIDTITKRLESFEIKGGQKYLNYKAQRERYRIALSELNIALTMIEGNKLA
jgi:hypothetical protein